MTKLLSYVASYVGSFLGLFGSFLMVAFQSAIYAFFIQSSLSL